MRTSYLAVIGFVAAVVILEANERADERIAQWEGAVVVRICPGGVRVYRLRNGEYRISDWSGSRVENPETVCAK